MLNKILMSRKNKLIGKSFNLMKLNIESIKRLKENKRESKYKL